MKILLTITGILLVLSMNAQHEGIMRYFHEYRMEVYPQEAFVYSQDTNLAAMHRFEPNKSSLQFAPQNIGGPVLPMIYSLRNSHSDFVFFDNYLPYINQHKSSIYYDTKKPFTIFKFNGGANEMDDVRLLHTQNVNPSLNFGADYRVCNSTGHYLQQKSKTSALNLFAGYTHHRYQAHFNFIFNKISHFNNGGISSDSIFEYSGQRTQNIPISLYNSSTTLVQTGIQFRHEVTFGASTIDSIFDKNDTLQLKSFNGRASLEQIIQYDRYYRLYQDIPSAFYPNIYIDSLQTLDSINLRVLKHELMFKYRLSNDSSQNISFLEISAISDLEWYHQYNSNNLFINNGVSLYYQQSINNSIFSANAKTYFMGRKAGDLNANANFVSGLNKESNHSLQANLNFSLTKPNFWTEHYYSNHVIWDNNFVKQTTGHASAQYTYKPWEIWASLDYYYLNDYIIFNQFAHPQQITSANQIAGISIGKLFNWKSLYWNNVLYYQKVTHSEQLQVPEYSGLSNLYFEHFVFNKAMLLQIGVDVWYHSEVYGPAYMPATGAFYLQSERKTGNYLLMDIYASFKVKRLRAFIRMGHFNDAFMPTNYFNMLHQPDRPMALNFGISWEFYD